MISSAQNDPPRTESRSGNIIKLPRRGKNPPPPPNPPDGSSGDGGDGPPPDDARRRLLGSLGACVVTGVSATLFVGDSSSVRTFTTDVGEQRSIPFRDGSTVMLNTDSSLRIWWDGTLLRAELLRGEVLFDMKPSRRLLVSIGDVEITEVGTVSAVRILDDGGVRVTVVEGDVWLAAPHIRKTPVFRNQRVSLPYRDHPSVVHTETFSEDDVRNQLSWRYGDLAFSCATLLSAAQEFGRYNRTKIEVVDPSDDELIGGIFSAIDPLAFVRSVTFLYPDISLEIDDISSDHRILRLRRRNSIRHRDKAQRRRENQCHPDLPRRL